MSIDVSRYKRTQAWTTYEQNKGSETIRESVEQEQKNDCGECCRRTKCEIDVDARVNVAQPVLEPLRDDGEKEKCVQAAACTFQGKEQGVGAPLCQSPRSCLQALLIAEHSNLTPGIFSSVDAGATDAGMSWHPRAFQSSCHE